MREQIAKLEVGNAYDENGNRIGGLVKVGNKVASKILSLVRKEIKRIPNTYHVTVMGREGYDQYPEFAIWEEARQSILKALDKYNK